MFTRFMTIVVINWLLAVSSLNFHQFKLSTVFVSCNSPPAGDHPICSEDVIQIKVFQQSSAFFVSLLGRWRFIKVDVSLRDLIRPFSGQYYN